MEKLDIDFVMQRLGTHSPYGEEKRRGMAVHPASERAEVERKLELLDRVVAIIKKDPRAFGRVDSYLCEFNMLRGSAERIRTGKALNMTELHEMKAFAINVNRVADALREMGWQGKVGEYMPLDMGAVIEILDPNGDGTASFHIYSSYSKKLEVLRARLEQMKKLYEAETKPALEKLEEDGYSVFQGVIRVKKADEIAVRRADEDERLIFRSESPSVRSYFAACAKSLDDEMEKLKQEEDEEETRVREELSLRLAEHLDVIEANFDNVGEIDLLIAKARFAVGFNLVRPRLGNHFKIVGGFHLRVRNALESKGSRFVPIDIDLSKKVSIITGANMGGKTVSIKLIGQCAMLAQMGFFVPCESAEIELFDRIFISVGDDQDVDLGLSTFGSEMMKLLEVLRGDYKSALVLVDELARGTNPSEGAALSIALVEHLMTLPVKAVITTHFDGLTEVPGVAHYQVIGLENADLSALTDVNTFKLHEFMDYRLREAHSGKEIPKEAIRIAEILGLDLAVAERARQILDQKKL